MLSSIAPSVDVKGRHDITASDNLSRQVFIFSPIYNQLHVMLYRHICFSI